MSAKQKTIKYSVSCTGVGLHTGVQSTVTFHPADPNTGIKFVRNDKGDKVVTPYIDNVVDLTRGTTIEENGVRVHTCLLYTSPSPRDRTRSRMPSSA